MSEEITNTHDRTKCPNCENCITNLRQDVKRLEEKLAKKDEEIKVLKGVKEHLIQAAARLHKVGVEPDPDFEKEEWWQTVADCGARLARARLAEVRGDGEVS